MSRHGFYPERALEYDFSTYRPEDYFPDSSAGSPGRTIEPGEIECCRDKLFFALLMGAIGATTPPVLAENAGGRLIFYTDEADDFETLLAAHGELVVKPRGNVGGGVGVRIVRPGDPDPAPRPGEIATPRIQQHAYAATIYPGSANTIRLMTAWDYDRGDVFIAAAGAPVRLVARRRRRQLGSRRRRLGHRSRHRPARAGNPPSELRPAAVPARNASRHRGADRRPRDPPVPGDVRGLLAVARRFPRRYVAWDIVITPDAWTIVEANHIPDLSLFQLHRPVLLEPRLRTYYQREGVL